MHKSINPQKVALIGDEGVGKTSVLSKLIFEDLDRTCLTVGMDVFKKEVIVEGVGVPLRIWDTSGIVKSKSYFIKYLKKVSVGIIIFDVTNRDSFEHLETWIKDIEALNREDAMFVILGNKADLIDSRKVFEDEAFKKAKLLGMDYFDISAKTGLNIKNVFNHIASHLVAQYQTYPAKVDLKEKDDSKTSNSYCNC